VGEQVNGPIQSRQCSSTLGAIAAALAKAQGEMEAAAKANINPHFKSKYADLASVWDACRGPLSKNGLAVLQPVTADGPKVTITTILAHSSGEWISESLTMTAQQNTPQGVGSAITYGRRYGLSAMVGIAPDDDDGNAASGRQRAVSSVASSIEMSGFEEEAPTEPAGYAAWWLTMVKTSESGVSALREAWKKSPPAFRTFTTSQRAQQWDNLKLCAETAAEPTHA
jgi:hypothetical protein